MSIADDNGCGNVRLVPIVHAQMTPLKNEVSAMPCCDGEPDRSPSGGVAETLLHETAGRGLRYGDLIGDCRHDGCYLQWLRLKRCVGEATPLLRTAAAFDAGMRTLVSTRLDKP